MAERDVVSDARLGQRLAGLSLSSLAVSVARLPHLFLLVTLASLLSGAGPTSARAQETPTYYVDVASAKPVAPYTSWATAAWTIQDAIDAGTAPGRLVLVTNGVYRSGAAYKVGWNRIALTNAPVVRSVNGPEVTVIEGAPPTEPGRDNACRCAYVGAEAVLDGFTLTKGNRLATWNTVGGGAYCEPSGVLTNCVLTGNSAGSNGGGVYQGKLYHCTLTGNSAVYGGGAYQATLYNCTVTANAASADGGGAFGGTLYNCTLTGNSASGNGGGARWCSVHNCTLTGNSASGSGGGAHQGTLKNSTLTDNSAASRGGGACDGTLQDCTLLGNWAADGGGSAGGSLSNCALTGNSASGSGGGAYQGTLKNSTLTGNSAEHGGGARDCSLYNCTLTGNSALYGGGVFGGGLYNCLVYFNQGGQGANWNSAGFDHCCTTPLPPGPANIDADPQMASPTHLSLTSLCLGAGSPAYASGVDIDGQPWADPPAIGADQVWPGQYLGPLSLRVQTEFTQFGVGFPASFTADISGAITRSVWDFGDGTVVTNQPYAQHAWTAPGRHTVRLIGYNDSHPEGTTTSLEVEVIDAVYYVDAANRAPVFPYTSWATAAKNIQDAVGAASVIGRLVLVTNGVYQTGSVEADGPNRLALTNVVVRSVSGPVSTVIDGGRLVRCVHLSTNAFLSGFTLRNGKADCGGGVWATVLGVVTNCILTNNLASSGGGAYGGALLSSTLAGNTASGNGGGAYGSTLNDCLLTGNSAAAAGGGVFGGTLKNCALSENRAAGSGGGAWGGTLDVCTLTANTASGNGGGASGAALHNCALTGNSSRSSGGATEGGTLHNCTLVGNWASSGGGASGGALNNCTITGNVAEGSGGGVSGATLYNCLVFYNQAPNGANWFGEEWAPTTFEYSCTMPLPPGLGNIDADPQLASATHLLPGSPCLGAGNPAYTSGVDIDGQPWAAPPAIGADQVWPGESTGPLTLRIDVPGTRFATGFAVAFTADNTGPILRTVWDFGDGTVITNQPFVRHAWAAPGPYTVRLTGYNDRHPEGVTTSVEVEVIDAVHYVDAANPAPVFPYASWGTAATNIQDAVDAGSVIGRLVLVTNGLYRVGTVETNGLNRVVLRNVVMLRSVNGPEVTVIEGAQQDPQTGAGVNVRCAHVGNQSVLSGFTLRNGGADSGGGVLCGALGVVTNCTLNGNSAGSGGGASGGTLYHCTLCGNSAGSGGGASGGTLHHCTLTGNSAASGGGASGGTLYDCILTGNRSTSTDNWTGGGGGASGGTLYNCTLSGNSALGSGGGAFGGTLNNCTLVGNSASSGGGTSGGTLYSCTLAGNTASEGGGAAGYFLCLFGGCLPVPCTLYNCLVYFNQAPNGANWHGPCTFEYSCSTPLPDGPGNIDTDPQLASTTHLLPGSPCLAAGNRSYASGVDIDGEPWADPPAIGADQVWPGDCTGPLTLRIDVPFTQFVPGWDVDFTADNTGPILRTVWDFGDGTVVTNQPFVRHGWTVPGPYTVRLTGYNDSHPEGVTTSVEVEVIDAVHYVDAANPTPAFPYTTWTTAATNIQDAVDAGSVLGRLVLVTNGVYQSGMVETSGLSRVTLRNVVVVRSVNGPQVTVIEGAQQNPETGAGVNVRCAYVEDESVLSGFTLRNGKAESGGGVFCAISGAVTNCTLSGNSAGSGGGASGGTLYDCTLTGNDGWGAHLATLHRCTLTRNTGGGAFGGTLYNCTLTDNLGSGAAGAPPGWGSPGTPCTLYNCTLTGNSAEDVGGARYCTLNNCTVTGNRSWVAIDYSTLYNCRVTDNDGMGAYYSTLYNCTVTGHEEAGVSDSTLYNCTVTGNDRGGAYGSALYNCLVYFNQGANCYGCRLEYSCTTPLPPGPGNIDADPQLASATHLSPTSPCLGAGNTAHTTGVDIDGEPWATPPAIGADQVWPGESTGPLTLRIDVPGTRFATGFSVAFTADNTGPILRTVWDFGDGTVVTNQPFVRHAWTAPGPYTVQLSGYNDSHPEGVTTSVEVEVIDAVHYVDVANPAPVFPYTSWATAATNIQDAVDAGSVFGRLVLVTNGVYQTGTVEANGLSRVALRDVVGVRSVNGPEVTVIEGAQQDPQTGAGVNVRCAYVENESVLSGFTLRNGKGDPGGGVLCAAFGVVTNCTLNGNSASYGGGTAGGTLYHCTLSGNSAGEGGGACWGTLYDCTLSGNSAGRGGGASSGTLYHCTLSGNVASNEGGATYRCTLYNCLAYFNQAPNRANWSDCGLEYSCTTPLPGGPGNIDADPGFVNAAAGDFRLRYGSPCIDAGSPQYSTTDDLAGLPRPLDGDGDGVARPDMGAYEFDLRSVVPADWFTQHGLDATDPHVLSQNPDQDTQTSFQEWLTGTDPLDPLSFFRIEALEVGPPVTLFYHSLAGRVYTLYAAPDLAGESDGSTLWAPLSGQTAVPGTGGLGSLTDTNALPRRFYRVGVDLP